MEVLHGLRRSSAQGRRQASVGAVISMVIALLLINAPLLAGGRAARRAWRHSSSSMRSGTDCARGVHQDSSSRAMSALAMLGNVVGGAASHRWQASGCESGRSRLPWRSGSSARPGTSSYRPFTPPPTPTRRSSPTSGIGDHAVIARMTASVEASEAARARRRSRMGLVVHRDALRDPHRQDGP